MASVRVENHPKFASQYIEMAGLAPPVLRIPYVWFIDQSMGEELAVVMLIGDKTSLGNDWYPSVVNRIDNAGMVTDWERAHPGHKAKVRRTR